MSYIYFNPNPCKRSVGDCAVRAISKALDISWEKAYALITVNAFRMCDMPSSNAVWGAILRMNGFHKELISNYCPDCYTIEDFCNDHPEGIYVVGTSNHVVTIIDGNAYDSWNSLSEIPQFYWTI